jgi:hypothetical protein
MAPRPTRRLVAAAATAIAASVGAAVTAIIAVPDRVAAAVLVLLVGAATGATGLAARECWLRSPRAVHRLEAHQSRLLRAVEQSRAAQSRHEYLQESALSRIEYRTEAALGLAELALRSPLSVESTREHVLFVTSNGAGMGHVVRCLAVVDRAKGRFDATILTLSTAGDTLRANGYPVLSFPSKDASDMPWEKWHREFRDVLDTHVRTCGASAIVFDGAWVYRGLTGSATSL